jgi:glycosyltransferase involved in cell wall biosynthesis
MQVNIAMVSYNHERFIAKAIDSVLMQHTTFDYCLVIGEDCSLDRTREIVVSYQKRFPDKILTILQKKNVGPHNNFAQTLAACTGDYIAIIDGDDYWISPHKLQKQVEFLETHPDYSMCFHPVEWFDENYDQSRPSRPESKFVWLPNSHETSSIEDILKSVYIQSSSVVFRNHLLPNYPDWILKLAFGDWPFYVLLAHYGKIGCLNEVMSAYRRHAGGVWFMVEDEKRLQSVIKMYEFLNSHFENQYSDIIAPLLADQYFKLAVLYDQRGDVTLARRVIEKSVAVQIASRRKPSMNSIKMLARLRFPSAYHFSKRFLRA